MLIKVSGKVPLGNFTGFSSFLQLVRENEIIINRLKTNTVKSIYDDCFILLGLEIYLTKIKILNECGFSYITHYVQILLFCTTSRFSLVENGKMGYTILMLTNIKMKNRVSARFFKNRI